VSQANVDVVRKQIDAYRRGDWDDMAVIIDPHTFYPTRSPLAGAVRLRPRGSHRLLRVCGNRWDLTSTLRRSWTSVGIA
jgi:hypothetical protein